jgi:hypothetical protein
VLFVKLNAVRSTKFLQAASAYAMHVGGGVGRGVGVLTRSGEGGSKWGASWQE